jgi:hypothetical protein
LVLQKFIFLIHAENREYLKSLNCEVKKKLSRRGATGSKEDLSRTYNTVATVLVEGFEINNDKTTIDLSVVTDSVLDKFMYNSIHLVTHQPGNSCLLCTNITQ